MSLTILKGRHTTQLDRYRVTQFSLVNTNPRNKKFYQSVFALSQHTTSSVTSVPQATEASFAPCAAKGMVFQAGTSCHKSGVTPHFFEAYRVTGNP